MKKKIIISIFCLIIGMMWYALFFQRTTSINLAPSVLIGTKEITVSIAQTKEEQARGLSGRESLNRDEGMLFLFPKKDRYAFWMPDMNFPIDIIWIDHDHVVGVDEHATNVFDSKNSIYYYPPQPVATVLEVVDGFVSENHIIIGTPVSLLNTQ
jgi:uncharacterized protein